MDELAITVGAGRRNPRGTRKHIQWNGGGPVAALARELASLPAGEDSWWSGHVFADDHRQERGWTQAALAMVDADFHAGAEKKPTPTPAERERCLAAARAGRLAGNLFHETPHGIRLLFVFSRAVSDPDLMKAVVRGACAIAAATLAAAGLAEKPTADQGRRGFRVDSNARDLARFMFAPRCTVDGVPRAADVLIINQDVYDPDDLAAAAPPEPTAAPEPRRPMPHRPPENEIDSAAAKWNADHRQDWPRKGSGDCPACGGKGGFGALPEVPEKWFCWHETHPDSCGQKTDRGHFGDELDLEAHTRGCARIDVLRKDGYLSPQCGARTKAGKICAGTDLLADGRCKYHSGLPEARPAPRGADPPPPEEFPPIELVGFADEPFAQDSTAPHDDAPAWVSGAPPAEGEHLTELGNARRLVRQHGEDMRFCHPWGKWLVWDGRRWAPDNTGEAARRAKATIGGIYSEAANATAPDTRKAIADFAMRSEKSSAIAAMLRLAESEPGIPVLPEALDADPFLMAVDNGTLNLRTGELRAPRRADMITKLAPAAYDHAAGAPEWHRFLGRVFDSNAALIEFVQLWLGYCMTGDVSEHCMVVAHGTGRNGKSTLFETFAKIIGDYAGVVPSSLLMAQKNEAHPTERARLYGLRLAVTSETRAGQQLDEGQMKKITGGDKIDARRMREDFWDYTPTHKLVLYTNFPPRIRTTDEGTWSKILLLPFRVTIPASERDRGLKERLWAERAGILAWGAAGARRWAAAGLGDCKEVRDATDEYRTDQDTLGPWLAECCALEPGASAEAKALYESYKNFAAEEGNEKPMTQNMLGRILSERGIGKKPGTSRARLGIRIKTPIERKISSTAEPTRDPGEDG